MNKIVASVGLAALGASSMHAVAQDLGAPASKPWSVSASLRGFYDDNINTTHANQVDSMGVQFSPSAYLNWTGPATTVVASYVYALNYYEQRPAGSSSDFDSTHTFNGMLNHAFSERFQIGVNDSFVIGQEPDTLRAPAPLATNQRIPGDNIRNYGAIVFSAQLTPVFGTEVGYANTYVNYDGTFNNTLNPPFSSVIASPSGAMDRVENTIHVDARWNLRPTTVFLVGYMYDETHFTGDERIAGVNGFPATYLMSDQRNSRSQIGYAGVDHLFRPDFKGTLKVGVRYSSFPNDPSDSTQTSPYVRASLNYTYSRDSHIDFGFSYSQNATDVTGSSVTNFVRNTEAAVLYGSIRHCIVPKLFGSGLFTFQNSKFNGGTLDGQSEQYFAFGVNLQYEFTRYFSTEIGYNYDLTESEITARQYDRNRVYIGVTGTY